MKQTGIAYLLLLVLLLYLYSTCPTLNKNRKILLKMHEHIEDIAFIIDFYLLSNCSSQQYFVPFSKHFLKLSFNYTVNSLYVTHVQSLRSKSEFHFYYRLNKYHQLNPYSTGVTREIICTHFLFSSVWHQKDKLLGSKCAKFLVKKNKKFLDLFASVLFF